MSPSHRVETSLPPALADAWRADRASPGELSRGYQRFLKRKAASARVSKRMLTGWIAAGLVLGIGLAEAASLVPRFSSRGADRPSVADRPHDATRLRARQAAPSTEASLPSALAPASAGPVAVSVASTGAPRASSASAPLPAARVQARWQAAAAALRADDFAAAERALLDIELSTSGNQRDAARLARAQLLSSHGRAGDAAPILEDLLEHTSSELVRNQARSLASAKHEIVGGDRSTEPTGDTEGP